jgi:UrcA family protein
MQRYRKFVEISVFATLATAGLVASAAAQSMPDPWGVRSQRVSYRDLNLNDGSGARILMARVRRAAGNVCGPDEFVGLTGGRQQYYRCVETATARAVAELNNPTVTALANPDRDKARTSLAAAGP